VLALALLEERSSACSAFSSFTTFTLPESDASSLCHPRIRHLADAKLVVPSASWRSFASSRSLASLAPASPSRSSARSAAHRDARSASA
jgi:hypothetical protein